MAKGNSLKKYIDQLAKYNGGNIALAVEYTAYLEALRALSAKFESMDEKDGQEAPKLTAQDIEEIRKDYLKVFEQGTIFLRRVEMAHHVNDRTLKIRNSLVHNVEQVLHESSALFSGALGVEGLTLAEALDSAKGREIHMEAENIATVGSGSNVRIPLSFQTESGAKLEGFFTEHFDYDFERDRNELLERYSSGDKGFRMVLRELLKDEALMKEILRKRDPFLVNLIQMGGQEDTKNATRHIFARAFPGFDPKRAGNVPMAAILEFQRLLEKFPDLNTRMVNFLQEAPKFLNKYEIAKYGANIRGTKNIPNRNAAMTAVADLLGCGDLIARTTKMTLVLNGKRKEGVFMQKAEGEDLWNIGDDSAMADIDKKNPIAAECLSKIANLQILDYLCGNVDRHEGNVLYKTGVRNGKKQIVGFVAIDNDSALGVTEARNPGLMKFPALNQIRCIPEQMATRIAFLTPDMLDSTLRTYNLTAEEIESAKVRLMELQNILVTTKSIPVIKENQWANIDRRSLLFAQNVNGKVKDNHFVRFLRAGRSVDQTILDNKNLLRARRAVAQFARKHKYFSTSNAASDDMKGQLMREDRLAEVNFQNITQLQHEIDCATAFLGTDEYKKISKLLTEVGRRARAMRPEHDLVEWTKMQSVYELLDTKIETYLNRKEGENIEKLMKGKELSDTAKSRVLAMSNLKKFVEHRIASVKKFIQTEKEQPADFAQMQTTVTNIERDFSRRKFDPDLFVKWVAKKYMLNEHRTLENAAFSRKEEYNAYARLRKSPAFAGLEEELKNKRVSLAEAEDILNLRISQSDTSLDNILNISKDVPRDFAEPEEQPNLAPNA